MYLLFPCSIFQFQKISIPTPRSFRISRGRAFEKLKYFSGKYQARLIFMREGGVKLKTLCRYLGEGWIFSGTAVYLKLTRP